MTSDYYNVLGVSTDASFDDIKKQYQKLALRLHPDKQKNSGGSEADRETFVAIQEAYNVLKEENSRSVYDSHRQNEIIGKLHPENGEVDLDDMEFDESNGNYAHPCRCGGVYQVNEDDLEEGVEVICCSQCSLAIRILYEIAE